MATEAAPRRSTYRHGDTRRALIDAGVELARTGGPDAVVLREATRQVGVVPNAAYRHFSDRQALLMAVSDASQALLALAMEKEIDALPRRRDPARAARDRLRAVGTGYLRFAQAEPGLFRAAFFVPEHLEAAGSEAKRGESGLTPFLLLSSALDALQAAGVLPAERRAGAEFLAWSAVHGLALLLIDGPLRGLNADQREWATQRLIDMVEKGL
jgi:AcrR family transcriptional regulator